MKEGLSLGVIVGVLVGFSRRYLLLPSMLLVSLLLFGCDEEKPWNYPYPFLDSQANVLYMAFSERPKHLDPARSYSEPEWRFNSHIYEAPLQYHYLKRPYELEPMLAERLPEIHYFDRDGKELTENHPDADIAYSEYRIQVKPGIFYQNHPAFAKNSEGNYLYLNLSEKEASQYQILSDFKQQGTREVLAQDFVYQIKRLAEPQIGSPIYGVMSKHIVGLSELREELLKMPSQHEIDLRQVELIGARVIDRYTYVVRVYGKYPQFRFWLAMPFFTAIPWEVTRFYAQPGLEKHNISLDWYPLGTGPFELIENNPDRRMILRKNTNYRQEFYPKEGTQEDEKLGLLAFAGEKIPFLDKIVYTLETENIPYWNKFLQGYYDFSLIYSDNFNQAVQLSARGAPEITEELKKQNIRLNTSFSPAIWMWGFNMLDETVGGDSERAKVLRKAIRSVFDVQYFIDIFVNGRGERAIGPIPPEIFGFQAQVDNSNTITNTNTNMNMNMNMNMNVDLNYKSTLNKKSELKNKEKILREAKQSLKKVGITPGFTLYLDAVQTGDPEEIAIHQWMIQQFRKLDLNLIIRGMHVNRFQEKMRQGTMQIFFWGWDADYPDPENFLFLFYGPNGSAKHEGENAINYQNDEYDKLFEQQRGLPDNQDRLSIIRRMVDILQNDCPCIFGFYPKSYALYHQWVNAIKPSGIVENTLKYMKVDPRVRHDAVLLWNQPKRWPLLAFVVILIFIGVASIIRYIKQQQLVRGRV